MKGFNGKLATKKYFLNVVSFQDLGVHEPQLIPKNTVYYFPVAFFTDLKFKDVFLLDWLPNKAREHRFIHSYQSIKQNSVTRQNVKF